MDINLEYYKIFYYVAKSGSITLAAEELSLSQPAVSQSVRNLERQLKLTLFVRMKKGVRLTREGEILFSYVARGYESIRQGEKKARELLDLSQGEIHIGASDMTLQFYLLPWLEQFHRRYPQIKVTVTNAPTPETIQHLRDGRIDFGVVSSPIHSRHSWKLMPVRRIEDVFVAGNVFWQLKGKLLSYRNLEHLPILFLEGNTSTRSYVEEFLAQQGVLLHPEFELANSNMLIQFALRGLGVACVVRDFAKDCIDSGQLFELTFDRRIPQREICIITDEKIPGTTASRKLLDMMGQEPMP